MICSKIDYLNYPSYRIKRVQIESPFCTSAVSQYETNNNRLLSIVVHTWKSSYLPLFCIYTFVIVLLSIEIFKEHYRIS